MDTLWMIKEWEKHLKEQKVNKTEVIETIERGYKLKDSNIYCNCASPKKIISHALLEPFEVCTKSRGGCGKEIVDRKDKKICPILGGSQTLTNKTISTERLDLYDDPYLFLKTRMPPKLCIFLCDNNVLNEYCENFKNTNHHFILDFFTKNPVYYISCAFSWSKSNQDNKYWRDINNKWHVCIK